MGNPTSHPTLSGSPTPICAEGTTAAHAAEESGSTGSTTSSNATPLTKALRDYGSWASTQPHDGLLLGAAALVGLIFANSPWASTYRMLSSLKIGPAALNLNLSVSSWATDGLLAIFFFVVALELKHEMLAGSLRSLRHAAVPALAAVGGMICPALVFTTVMLLTGGSNYLRGWAIPTTTDIAFAVAVFTVFGRSQPHSLRTFLLTLAVVDDLLGIIIIALFYNQAINVLALLAAFAMTGVFALAVRIQRIPRIRPWLLFGIGLIVWGLMHTSGIHATMAGVMLGATVPERMPSGYSGGKDGLADSAQPGTLLFADAVQPFSSGIVLPVFAFFAAGVAIPWHTAGSGMLSRPILYAVVLGLVLGKPLGVLLMTAMVTRFTPLLLPEGLRLRDLIPVGIVAGIGFTVSLLFAQLAYSDPQLQGDAKLGVLLGTLIVTVMSAIVLHTAERRHNAHVNPQP